MASSDVVMIRDSGSSSNNIQQQYLCDLTGRVRTQESTCDKPGCTGYGATSSAATPLDSPTHSTDPPITFSEQEDEILRELVKRHGTKKWHIISAKMHKKTPRECRKRWRTYLHMCMNKSSWSAEEDHLLLQGHNAFGNRWTEIAKMVPGRTDNAVKNRYNALCTKRSHPAAKAVNGFSSSNGIKHHLVESWNDASGHQYEQELKRARRVAQEEEESISQPWMKVSFRAATMAYLKTNMIFETSCSRLDLGIDDIPQVDSDHSRTSVSRKRIIDLHEPGQIISQEEDYVLTNVGESTTSPKDVHVDMEEVMSWLLQSQTSTPTFDCSGNSNSTVTSCTPLTSVSTVLSCDSTNPDSFGAEQEGLNAKLNIQRCANNSIFEETLGFDTTAYFV